MYLLWYNRSPRGNEILMNMAHLKSSILERYREMSYKVKVYLLLDRTLCKLFRCQVATCSWNLAWVHQGVGWWVNLQRFRSSMPCSGGFLAASVSSLGTVLVDGGPNAIFETFSASHGDVKAVKTVRPWRLQSYELWWAMLNLKIPEITANPPKY